MALTGLLVVGVSLYGLGLVDGYFTVQSNLALGGDYRDRERDVIMSTGGWFLLFGTVFSLGSIWIIVVMGSLLFCDPLA
ncbi:MAG: hypothetical protein WBF53_15580 [Litorimonas sp.]